MFLSTGHFRQQQMALRKVVNYENGWVVGRFMGVATVFTLSAVGKCSMRSDIV